MLDSTVMYQDKIVISADLLFGKLMFISFLFIFYSHLGESLALWFMDSLHRKQVFLVCVCKLTWYSLQMYERKKFFGFLTLSFNVSRR